jgi:DNA (cytosine-5)-methyltransferase 1
MTEYSVGSMFAGVGGICLGFQMAFNNKSKYVLKWANEIDENACKIYELNFKHKLITGDINLVINPEKVKDVDF